MDQINIESIQQYYKCNHTPTLCCDRDLKIVWMNDAAAKALGNSGSTELNHIFPRIDAGYIQEHLSGKSDFYVELTDQDNLSQLHIHPVQHEGKTRWCFVLVESHTKLEPLWGNLTCNQNTLSLFASQNRFALTSIFNTISFLKSDLERYELYDEIQHLNHISSNCYTILKIILNCSEYNRLLYQKEYLKTSRVDLRAPLEHLLSGVKLLLLHTEIEFSYELPDEPLLTEADTEKLNIALLQLISNACKFTSPGNRVVVTIGRQKHTIMIRVSDKGVGIPPENLQKIFTPFFSFDPNTNSYSGIGLGLPYVQKIVRLHGGECIVSSSLNQGTTVSMAFPVKLTPGETVFESDNFEYVLGRFSPITVYLSDIYTIPID